MVLFQVTLILGLLFTKHNYMARTAKSTSEKTVLSKKEKSTGITAPLFDIQAKSLGNAPLPLTVFGLPANDKLIAEVVRVYSYNQRKAHAKAKERGEVAGTTKKMWAQKGTGRARHGSAKAAQFVGGGVAHGPRGNENFRLSKNTKVKKLALRTLLSGFATNKSILVIDRFSGLQPKTKNAWKLVDMLEKQNEILAKSKKIGIITSKPLTEVKRAFGNIPNVFVYPLNSLNTLNLSKLNFLILSQKAIKSLT